MSEAQVEEQQHPIAIYFWFWGALFVLSTLSYMVDYMQFEGLLRWSLIIIFMLLKAGFIVAVFMHLYYERLAMTCAIVQTWHSPGHRIQCSKLHRRRNKLRWERNACWGIGRDAKPP